MDEKNNSIDFGRMSKGIEQIQEQEPMYYHRCSAPHSRICTTTYTPRLEAVSSIRVPNDRANEPTHIVLVTVLYPDGILLAGAVSLWPYVFCRIIERTLIRFRQNIGFTFLFEIRIIEPMISILTTTWIKNAVVGIEPTTYRLWACRANHCAIQQRCCNWDWTNDL